MQNKKIYKLVKVSVLSAISLVLMMVDFPLPVFPTFLKVDLSDIPALFGAFAMGPVAGVVVEFIKNVLHLLAKSDTAGIGELANFIIGAAFVYCAGAVYKIKKDRLHAMMGLAAGTIAMAISAVLGNYFVFLPLYGMVPEDPIAYLMYIIVPFNIIKGIIISVIVFFTYKRVSPILHK